MDKKTTTIDSDNRFGPLARNVASRLRSLFFRKQQKIVADVKIELEKLGFQFISCLRNPDGSGGDDLKKILLENSDRNKIIILTPTLVNPQDAALLTPEIIMKWVGRIAELFIPSLTMETTPKGYISYTTQEISDRIYPDERPLVIGVLNTTVEDVKEAIAFGGNNTVLLLVGHGGDDSYITSNGELPFASVTRPEKMLRAIIKHACYKINPDHKGVLAQDIYSWNRPVSPIDWVNTFGEG